MLFSADNITSVEKVLRSYLNTTSSIAGCQAIRSKICHCWFGFRVVHGEVIFVTVSPNRRHSAMILKLSRARRNDVSLLGDDEVARSRQSHCGPNTPHFFSTYSIADDPERARHFCETGLERSRPSLKLSSLLVLHVCCVALQLSHSHVFSVPRLQHRPDGVRR